MATRIMLVPAGESAGLTTASLGMVRALQQQSIRVKYFKPVADRHSFYHKADESTTVLKNLSNLQTSSPLSASYVEAMISNSKSEVLLEEIIGLFEHDDSDTQVELIEGLVSDTRRPYTVRLNRLIGEALDAKLILVMNPGSRTFDEINQQLEISTDNYGGHRRKKLLGCIFNKLNAPLDEHGQIALNLSSADRAPKTLGVSANLGGMPIFSKRFSCIGMITWNGELNAPRVLDLCRHMDASLLNESGCLDRRIRSVHFCAREVPNMIPVLKPGALLVISADRSDIIVSVCLSTMNGTQLGAILLTGSYDADPAVMQLCEKAFATGLPVLKVSSNTWETAIKLQSFNQEVPGDDEPRISRVMDHTASCIDEHWIQSLAKSAIRPGNMSPPAFRYKLTKLAREANKTIVLPEGEEPRTIAAAAICAERGIAKCVLLGDPAEIERAAALQDIHLGDGVELCDPASIRDTYIAPMVDLRGHKGVTEVIAEELLLDNNVLGTLMLQQGGVDGLVSGAVGTTANTIRPALQFIKTAPDASLVSSIFFMLLPDQVLVYGDCAINPDPNATQLAEIAIQSAESAIAFGIEPRVAMLSYSTGTSGSGQDVEKVREATAIAKEKRPDLIIDGPLQYDAAVMENVALKKAPNSPVAGKATVLIFPDLNTGNTTYKAVQRSADLVSIGPMLQGLYKPVNDLSRGALVDDIVYTIALTAIQAGAS